MAGIPPQNSKSVFFVFLNQTQLGSGPHPPGLAKSPMSVTFQEPLSLP